MVMSIEIRSTRKNCTVMLLRLRKQRFLLKQTFSKIGNPRVFADNELVGEVYLQARPVH